LPGEKRSWRSSVSAARKYFSSASKTDRFDFFMPFDRENVNSQHWIILTGEYPPDTGGVADYARLVAETLTAYKDSVEVWAPPQATAQSTISSVRVHRLPDHFGIRSLSILGEAFRNAPSESRVLVQYVPQAFGLKGMNLFFCVWLWFQRKQRNITVMFHEVATPWERRVRPRQIALTFLAVMTRIMAFFMARSARRIFVTIPMWKAKLNSFADDRPIEWLPVPSTVATTVGPQKVSRLREQLIGASRYLIGHFGTFGGHIASALRMIVPRVLAENNECTFLFVGRGSETLAKEILEDHPQFKERLRATCTLEAGDVSEHLSACDLIIQPYIDGISSRRTSAMASVALGLPILTTKGPLTEPIWGQSNAVRLSDSFEELADQVVPLLRDTVERARIGEAAASLYRKEFHIDRTIAGLRGELRSSDARR
jgi:hypothetical protein